MSEIEFTKAQRLILINQYEILKLLNPDLKEHYDKEIDILSYGYAFLYHDEFSYINDEVPLDVCQTVFDVLSMYRSLYFGYINLSDEKKEKVNEADVLFKGFDGNEEIPHYVFAKFLVEKYDSYHEIKQLIEAGKVDMNSHWPELSRYEEMLERWTTIREETAATNLNADQISYIVGRQ